MVRFCAVYRIKPHVPPLALATVNSFEFRPCGYIPQADSFTHSLQTPSSSTRVCSNIILYTEITNDCLTTLNYHSLRYGLQGSLIPFDTHTFVT